MVSSLWLESQAFFPALDACRCYPVSTELPSGATLLPLSHPLRTPRPMSRFFWGLPLLILPKLLQPSLNGSGRIPPEWWAERHFALLGSLLFVNLVHTQHDSRSESHNSSDHLQGPQLQISIWHQLKQIKFSLEQSIDFRGRMISIHS